MRRVARLHARSRGLTGSGTALLGVAVVGAWSAGPLSAPAIGLAPVLVQVLTVTAAVAVVGAGLAGADPDLERSTPHHGPRLRMVHLAVVLCGVTGVLTLSQLLIGPAPEGAATSELFVTARDVLGLVGLLALTATFVGARLAWTVPVLWVLAVVVVGPREHGWRLVASMPLLPSASTTATVVALALLVLGATAYAVRGAPR